MRVGALLLTLICGAPLGAQETQAGPGFPTSGAPPATELPPASERAFRLRIGGLAVVSASRLEPAPGGGSASEVRLEQPVLFVHGGSDGRIRSRFHGALNLEGLTIPGGVLTAGTFGEGFVDRRHPHTYLHEMMASVEVGGFSLAAGKGFAAFGTDDPMDRPALRYPVNHHWAQILERVVLIAGVRGGPIVVEGSLFNGDEPESPGQWPRFSRVGDSWSARVFLRPWHGVEVQASRAEVKSPEHRPGAGPLVIRRSASARFEGEKVYALVEWARTTEADGFFDFGSALAEIAPSWGERGPYFRFERTERPEEERTFDPFRTQRPHLDDSILGITRWRIHTAGWRHRTRGPGGTRLEPLAEVSLARVAKVGGGLFEPTELYGGSTVWSLTAAVRIVRGPRHRMGRYGVGTTEEEAGAHEEGAGHDHP